MKKVKITQPDTKLVSVYQTSDPIKADMVRDRLEENGIDAVVDGEGQAGFSGVLPVNVLVRESDSVRANSFIESVFSSQ